MYILDPDRDGCTVWRISPNSEENYVTHIRGTCESVVNTLLHEVTTNDIVYIDNNDPTTRYYQDIFRHYGISVTFVPRRARNPFYSQIDWRTPWI